MKNQRAILGIQLPCDEYGNPREFFTKGPHKNCTRIEAIAKPGEYSFLPYVRVWENDKPIAEVSQHKLEWLLFDEEEP